MFPMIKARLENCEPDAHYYVYLDAVPVDADRYRYVYEKSAWCSSGKADRIPPNRLLVHPDSPFTGASTAVHTISFEKAKLTNNESNSHGMLILNSMHRYQPRLHVLQRDRTLPPLANGGQNVDLRAKEFRDYYRTFQFDETQFMAVTAYQNQLVTEMKIGTNPFAKGFRDHGNRRDPTNEFIDVAAMSSGTTQMDIRSQSTSQPYPLDRMTTVASTPKNGVRAQPLVDAQFAAAAAAYAAANALFPSNFFDAAAAGERLAAMVAAAGGVSFPPNFARQQLNNYFQQQKQQQQGQRVQQNKIESSVLESLDGHLKLVRNDLTNNVFGTTSEGSMETTCDPSLTTVEAEPLIDVDNTVDNDNEEVDVDDTVRQDSVAIVAKLRKLSETDCIKPKLEVKQQNLKSSDEQEVQSPRRKYSKPLRKCKPKA